MQVEVVLAEVGEDRHVEEQAVDAVQGQRVTAHFHDTGVDVRLSHTGHKGVHIGCLRGGAGAREADLPDPGLDGADQADDVRQRPQRTVQHIRRRRLAVRAGDPHHRHSWRLVVIDVCRKRPEVRARTINDEDWGRRRVRSPVNLVRSPVYRASASRSAINRASAGRSAINLAPGNRASVSRSPVGPAVLALPVLALAFRTGFRRCGGRDSTRPVRVGDNGKGSGPKCRART